MADEPDDELLLTDVVDEQHKEPSETDDVTIEIEGDDEPEETPLIKQLRQRERDQAREIAELRRKTQPAPIADPGPEPELEAYDWDEARFKTAWRQWNEAKQSVADRQRQQEEQTTARNHAFERQVQNYRGRAAQLGVKDFAEVEQQVTSKVPELLRNAVLQYADDPAKVMYALGKHPARLDKLLADGDPETGGDPIKFIKGIWEIERTMKVVNRRKPPEPEAPTIQRGSAPIAGGMTQEKYTKRLEQLEEEASRNGGKRTKIREFKSQYKGKFS